MWLVCLQDDDHGEAHKVQFGQLGSVYDPSTLIIAMTHNMFKGFITQG